MIRKTQKSWSDFLLYAFGFVLLCEWLRPLEVLTETANIWIFMLFAAISLLFAYLGSPIIISTLIKCLFILYALHILYFEGSFFQFDWIGPIIGEFFYNFGVVFERDWPEITNMFRSSLLLVLIWLMCYLIQYWLMNRRQIFIFFLMTLIFITVLDTFTIYVANAAIIRSVIVGFAVMGMLTFYRLIDRENISNVKVLSPKWMIPFVVLLFLSVGLGVIAPKLEPIWPDPVPFIESYSQNSENEDHRIGKVGYGEDDSQLGGPFLGDDRTVFTAEVESSHYWKVETKDVYTGKGWITSESQDGRIPFDIGEAVPITSFENSGAVELTEETSFVHSEMDYPHVVYPLGIKEINDHPASFSYELEPVIEKIHTLEIGLPASIPEYQVVYDKPRYSVTALRTATDETHGLSDAFMERYTQLPKDLPDRVRDLAAEITGEHDNWFDKARALEGYFNSSGFTYSQLDVAVPAEDQDYVDQFLFETKIGYCDNFSTSMVALARALDMPARWVKGYTQGERLVTGTDSGLTQFEITNNNAHSWVEIYFPQVGWVSFEPTQGFSNGVQFNFDTESENANLPETEEPQTQETQELPKEAEEKSAQTPSLFFQDFWNRVKDFANANWKIFVLSVLLILLFILLLYKKRGRWLPHYFVWRFKKTKDDEHFQKAYVILLKELDRYGLKRENGQTLRDYALEVDTFFSSMDMSKLTARYEQIIYRGVLKEGSWMESKKLWENLIIKTIA